MSNYPRSCAAGLTLLLSLVLSASHAQIYITHGNWVDVESQTIHPDYTLVIRNDTIVEIGPSSKLRAKPGAQVVDATGKWLMPGLVDAHVHFFQTGGLYTRPDAIDLRQTHPYETELSWYKQNMEGQLRRYLSCGITTVIDDGATLALLKQRDSFSAKAYAPRILMAGPLVSTNYTPKPFDVLADPDQPFYPVTTPDEAVKMTKKEYPWHPDFIKIWYIIAGADVTKIAYDNLPIVKAVIEESHRNNYKVAVHATEKITSRLAVEAGADYLVHEVTDSVVDDSFVRLLKQRGVVLCPTLTVDDDYVATFGQTYVPSAEDKAKADPVQLGSLQELRYLPDSTVRLRYEAIARRLDKRFVREDSNAAANLKKMVDAGVFIATGTDAGNPATLHASSYFQELRAMRKAGLTNWQILTASTLNGARVLGREKEFGSLAKGKLADLLILNANPIEDLANWERIDRIYHRSAWSFPDSLILPTPVEIVQRQVNAYNDHDLEAFLGFYADTAALYQFPGTLLMKGKADMRKEYAFLTKVPTLHVTIADRIVLGNKVIDHEKQMVGGKLVADATATYVVEGGRIVKVLFTDGKE